MPRSSRDDWDTPGGPGGQEVLAQVGGTTAAGSARALLQLWRQAVDTIAIGRVFKTTVKPAEFNTFRRARLVEGITDEQLAASFEIFAAAVIHGPVRVRHGDLWRAYSGSWARWVDLAPAPATRPLKDRQRSTPRQR